MILKNEELHNINEKLHEIDGETYDKEGWSNIVGGFVYTEIEDYSDDKIFVKLVQGVESDEENRKYEDHIILDRKTLNIIKDWKRWKNETKTAYTCKT